MNEKAQVRAFRRKYGLKRVDSAALTRALEQQGFTVAEFNGVHDDRDVSDLIDALRVRRWAESCRCFTYRDEQFRIVFLHEGLNEEERTVVLAHEEGHIWNGHMTQEHVLGEDVLQERQANEFAHYLLRDPSGARRRAAVLAVVLAALICALCIWKTMHDRAVYTDYLYRTRAGSKYHLRGCMYIRDRRDVVRLTRQEYESGEYGPCEACLPDAER